MRVHFAWMVAVIVGMTAAADEGEFADPLTNGLAPGWTWRREDPRAWRTSPAGLEVRVQRGNLWGPANNAKNVLVRPAPDPAESSIDVAVTITNRPTSQYEQVDLVWYYDDRNMVKIGQELVDGKLSVVMGREQNDRTRTIAIIPLDTFTVRLRLIAQGRRIQGQFQKPGQNSWEEAGECELPVNGAPNVSLQFYQGPADLEHWARVSDFRLRRVSTR